MCIAGALKDFDRPPAGGSDGDQPVCGAGVAASQVCGAGVAASQDVRNKSLFILFSSHIL